MSKFDVALPVIFDHEGGDAYTDDPVDPGGATRWGISLRFLRARGDLDGDGELDGDVDSDGDVDAVDIRNLPRARAAWLYRTSFWEPNRLSEVLVQSVATKLVDVAVNVGSAQMWKLVQRAATKLGKPLIDDGKVGPKTLAAVNCLAPHVLVRAVCNEQRSFYEQLIARRPKLARFRRGWIRRAAWPHTPEELQWLT